MVQTQDKLVSIAFLSLTFLFIYYDVQNPENFIREIQENGVSSITYSDPFSSLIFTSLFCLSESRKSSIFRFGDMSDTLFSLYLVSNLKSIFFKTYIRNETLDPILFMFGMVLSGFPRGRADPVFRRSSNINLPKKNIGNLSEADLSSQKHLNKLDPCLIR